MILPQIPLDLDLLPETKGVYIVGGTTRDLLLGRTPVDYDIAVSQNPEVFAEMTAARGQARLVRMGRPGKRSYRVVAGKTVLDITGVNGPTIRHDLYRRDVTINAMAIEAASGTLLDWVEGQKDLSKKRIRMVSEKGLQDDPIRLLRVFRLAATLGFQIEESTLSAVSQHAHMINFSAGERIRAELYKIFSNRHSTSQVAAMAETGLLSAVLPELTLHPDTPGAPHGNFLSAYNHLENLLNHPPSGLGAKTIKTELPWFSDQAAWQKFAILMPPGACEPSRQTDGIDPVTSACRRLRLSVKEKAFVTGILHHTPCLFHLHNTYVKKSLTPLAVTQFFMAIDSLVPHLLLHGLAKTRGDAANLTMDPTAFPDFARHMLHAYRTTFLPRKARPPLVTGRDLMTVFGLAPSLLFKKILVRVEESRLSGDIADRKSALEMAGNLIPGKRTAV